MDIFLHLQTRLTIFVLLICTFISVFSKIASFVFFGAHAIQGFEVSIFYHFALSRRSSDRFSTSLTFFFGNCLFYFRDVNGVIGEYSACLKRSACIFFKLYGILCFSLNHKLYLLNWLIDKNAILLWADVHLLSFVPLGRLFCRRMWWNFASVNLYLRSFILLNIYFLRKTLWSFDALFLLAISKRILGLNRLSVHDLWAGYIFLWVIFVRWKIRFTGSLSINIILVECR